MSAEESQVPGPPTWREYLDARLAVLATKDDLREVDRRIGDMESRLIRWIVGTAIAVAAIVIGALSLVG